MNDPNVDGYLRWLRESTAVLNGRRVLCGVPAMSIGLAFEGRAVLIVSDRYAACFADGVRHEWERDKGYRRSECSTPTGFDELIPEGARDLWMGKDEQQKQ
jgi:hypothetical protein